MASYGDLIQSIQDHDELTRSIREMAVNEQSLDLVRPDWEQVLTNTLVYKEFVSRCSKKFSEKKRNDYFDVQRLRGGESTFNVTTLGRFRIVKSLGKNGGGSSLIGATDPIDKILQVMTTDVDPSIERNNTHKFFFERCNHMICKYCRDALAQMRKKGIKVPASDNQSCITKCKVYDGQQVKNTFRSMLESGAGGDLLAAVTVNINCRYFFKHNDGPATVKIGGAVKNVLFFKESTLKPTETVYLGDLNDVCVDSEQEQVPAETYKLQPSMEVPHSEMTEEAFLDSLGINETNSPKLAAMKCNNEEYEEEDETEVFEAIPTAFKKRRIGEVDDEFDVTVERFEMAS